MTDPVRNVEVDSSASAEQPGAEIQKRASGAVARTQEDVEADLRKANKYLSDCREVELYSSQDIVTSEKDLDKLLMRQARTNMVDTRESDEWYTTFTGPDVALVMVGSGIAGCLAAGITAFVVSGVLDITGIFCSIGLLGGAFAGFIGGVTGVHPYPTIRNKVIFRKRYKRELASIVEKNKSNVERYEKLRKNLGKKKAKAEKIVARLAVEYEKNNPGKSLRVDPSNYKIIEVYKPQPTLAQKILNGSGE